MVETKEISELTRSNRIAMLSHISREHPKVCVNLQTDVR